MSIPWSQTGKDLMRLVSPPSLRNSLNVDCQSTSSADPETSGLHGSLPLDTVFGGYSKVIQSLP